MQMTLAAGGFAIPVDVVKEGKKLALLFRNYAPLREEVKAMRGAEFKNPARWLITDCPRNRLQLELLSVDAEGLPLPVPAEIARYDAPLLDARPRRKNLRQHQVGIFQFELTRKRCVVAAEMGTGKSLPTIEAMEHVGGEWWWVGPKKPLDSIKLEFKKWDAKVTPTFVTYHMLRKTLERLPKKAKAPRGVVFDESSYLKSWNSGWTQAAAHLVRAIAEESDGYAFLLSGLPDPNDPVDWWAQVEIPQPGFLRESSPERLRQRLIRVTKVGQTPTGQKFPEEWEWRWDEVELLGKRLNGMVLVINAEDCQDLPELQVEVIDLPPTAAALRAARLVVNTAETAMGALDKCRQLSDGFQYTADSAVRCDTPKDQALADFLERNEEVGRTMVYASYRESIDRCVDLCLAAGWNVLRCDGRGWATFVPGKLECTCATSKCKCDGKRTPKEVDTNRDEWLLNLDRTQDPRTLDKVVLVGHPKSGGYGLNLTACREGLAYSLDFNYGDHAQLKKRGHREGMDLARGFKMTYLCHLPTDRYVLKNHDEKRNLHQVTLGEIKSVLA